MDRQRPTSSIMRPLASLGPESLAGLRRLVGDHPMFRFYLDAGLEAVRRGEANRSAWISASHNGAALGICFDRLEVRTLIGELAPEDEIALAQFEDEAELHAAPASAARIAAALPGRVRSRQGMRCYVLDGRPSLPADPRCRRLGPSDYDRLADHFLTHYPEGVFSKWMLDGVFLGLFERQDLLACAGVIDRDGGAAIVGNFLTLPTARGRGLARALASTRLTGLRTRGRTSSC
jgi:hypothetical protein